MRKIIVSVIMFIGTSVLAEEVPPESFMGVKLLESTKDDLLREFGESNQTYFYKHANSSGYCYKSLDDTWVAFMLSGPSKFDSIEVSKRQLSDKCTNVQIAINNCISSYCIGMSRSEIELALNKRLEKVDYPKGDDLEVAYYEYSVPMPDDRAEHFPGIAEIPINHNVWFRFDNEVLYAVGIWKVEHLP
ncbi:hypothetical protein ACXYTJ_17075 [Gilvimarinus sp. F26214L]|uniref:hypothetical protein n=1 Tax=Gilvimarinus sp. DZF01 TaxID=3461371 RepID=UPI004045F4FB